MVFYTGPPPMAQTAETTHHSSGAYSNEHANGSLTRRWLRAAAFWSAVVLPFLHLPLLAAGLRTQAEIAAFAILLGLNLLAVYVGHGHRPTGVGGHR